MHRSFAPEGWRVLLAASVLALAVGCGGADGTNNDGNVGDDGQNGGSGVLGTAGAGGTIGAGGSTGTGGSGSNYPPGCAYEGIELTRQSVSEQPGRLSYRAINATQAPFDVVYLESYQGAPYNGPTTPGTYDLNGTNYADCGLCLLANRGCGTDGNCDQTFYANIGQVRIDAIGGDDFKLRATLIDVIFREVTINPTTWVSTPIDGGDLWCAYETDLVVERIATQPVCVEEGTGIELDENIGNFSLQQCSTGKFIDVHSFCGQEKALWMMAVTGWCPACAQAVPAASQAEQTTPGLDVLILYAEDENYQTPTLQNCRNYAASHSISADKLFLDPGWQTFFGAINPHLSNEILLPWNAVFDGDNMEYEYCDSCNTGDLNTALNAALND